MKKKNNRFLWLAIVILIFLGLDKFRGTPDSEVPYPDINNQQRGKAAVFKGRPIPYHEIFLAWRNWTDLHLIIYNDLNSLISADDWADLKSNVDKIKKESGADYVVFNGPRFWVLDEIGAGKSVPIGDIMGHKMLIPAFFTMSMKAMKDRKPYHEIKMNRLTKYTYYANDYIYKLISPNGTQYVMQAASKEILKDLSLEDLKGLGDRMKELPEGWKYEVEWIEEEFVNISTGHTIIVQDEFRNTYQIAPDLK
ncbi:hypothetical protein K5X82_10065 [Halosquirtibacter xylanolyticus]|uniref:hypothetical protein n=1 Tax=Halosquirtibacter xylanolyticus TaxID=3374599 RepID=UPI003749EA08|nr:hypothetical protein K5X82_10065 [Prolixibacteraceae bacterium]